MEVKQFDYRTPLKIPKASPEISKYHSAHLGSKSQKKLNPYSLMGISPSKSSQQVLNRKTSGHLSNSPRIYQSAHANAPNKFELPMSSKSLLKSFASILTPQEEHEVEEYDIVYFLGIRPIKTHGVNLSLGAKKEQTSCDNEFGDYILNTRDHLAFRYEIISMLGKGTFGQVVKCFDHKHHEEVAVKVIKNKKSYHKQAIIELKILQKLRQDDPEGKYNIVKIKNYFLFRKHICITFELLSISLYDLLTQNNYEGLSLTLIHRFAVQLLVCLQFMSKHDLIHCDLKPENILLKSTEKALINVIDFGSSCVGSEKRNFYIQSRFYRAPEVILENFYGMEIDIWSLGCILAELFTGFPLFPGESEHHQLWCIMQILGVPPVSLIRKSPKATRFFTEKFEPRNIPDCRKHLKPPGTIDLKEILIGASSTFIDFIEKCLIWEPENRIKPLEGLEHPFITEGLKRKTSH